MILAVLDEQFIRLVDKMVTVLGVIDAAVCYCLSEWIFSTLKIAGCIQQLGRCHVSMPTNWQIAAFWLNKSDLHGIPKKTKPPNFGSNFVKS